MGRLGRLRRHMLLELALPERSRWIAKLVQGIDWAAHSFAARLPTPQKAHTAALTLWRASHAYRRRQRPQR